MVNGQRSMVNVYLSLGSNLGDRATNLDRAIQELRQQVGTLVRCSSYFNTEPWGFQSPHGFLNAAVILRTSLTPQQLLLTTQSIERKLGRKSKTPPPLTPPRGRTIPSPRGGLEGVPAYSDRPIDIDILFYGNQIVREPELTIPHPLIQERDFVLRPLAEIAPMKRHPLLHRTIRALLKELQ